MNSRQVIRCNKCGTLICDERKLNNKDYLSVNKIWGYFSQKDCEINQFNICEDCYDKLIKEFVIPVEIEEKTEVL